MLEWWGSFSQTLVNSHGKISQNKDVEQVSVPLPALFAETAKSFCIRDKMNNFTFAESPQNQYSNSQPKARIEYEKATPKTLHLPERYRKNHRKKRTLFPWPYSTNQTKTWEGRTSVYYDRWILPICRIKNRNSKRTYSRLTNPFIAHLSIISYLW